MVVVVVVVVVVTVVVVVVLVLVLVVVSSKRGSRTAETPKSHLKSQTQIWKCAQHSSV